MLHCKLEKKLNLEALREAKQPMEAKKKDAHRDLELNKLGYPVVRLPYDKPSFGVNSITNQVWWNAYLFYCGQTIEEKFK